MRFYSCKKWQVPTKKSSSKEIFLAILTELQDMNSSLNALKAHNSRIEWLLIKEKDKEIKKLKLENSLLKSEKNKKKGCKRK